MGQHSHKPSPSGTRRWTAIAAGVAVIATASSAAWAAFADDSPKPSTAQGPTGPTGKPTDPAREPATPNEAARQPAPKTPSPAPTPLSASRPNPTKPTAEPATSRRPVKAETKAAKPRARVLASGSCGASFYDEPQMTASGERFNPSAMTAAHKTLPLGSKVRVTNPNTGESVTVRINDRGPYIGGRCLDLSAAAFAAIGNKGAGVMRVRYEVLAR